MNRLVRAGENEPGVHGPEETSMETALDVALVVALAAVTAVLAVGVVGLVRGVGDPRRAQRLMRARIATQALALIIVVAILALRWSRSV
jgi:hypothetical protein